MEMSLYQVSPFVLTKIQQYPVLKTLLPVADEISDPNHWRTLEFYLTPDVIAQVQEDIPVILESGSYGYFELGNIWYLLHWFLTGDSEKFIHLKYLIENSNDSNLLLVNAVSGGTFIDEGLLTDCQYFEAETVIQLAEALTKISKQDFRDRWDKLPLPPDTSLVYDWYHHIDDEDFQDFQGLFSELVDYFQEAAAEGNAIIRWDSWT